MVSAPFFSICIPQFNRTSYLLLALHTYGTQTFRDFEICISDDVSTDGRISEVESKLQELKLPYTLHRRTENGRYDVNLRTAIGIARGKYALLMGNDDCLAHEFVLERLHQEFVRHTEVGVALINYIDFTTREVTKRVFATELVDGGPELATRTFRNFSFVSGVILNRRLAQTFETSAVDGSEMYQMHIGTRILAEGHPLLRYDSAEIVKDIAISGETPVLGRKPEERKGIYVQIIPILAEFGRTAFSAIDPYTAKKSETVLSIFLQLYCFTYAVMILGYRRHRSWMYAFRAVLGLQPHIVLRRIHHSLTVRFLVEIMYVTTMTAALLVPLRLFDLLKNGLHRFAKRTTVSRASLASQSSEA